MYPMICDQCGGENYYCAETKMVICKKCKIKRDERDLNFDWKNKQLEQDRKADALVCKGCKNPCEHPSDFDMCILDCALKKLEEFQNLKSEIRKLCDHLELYHSDSLDVIDIITDLNDMVREV